MKRLVKKIFLLLILLIMCFFIGCGQDILLQTSQSNRDISINCENFSSNTVVLDISTTDYKNILSFSAEGILYKKTENDLTTLNRKTLDNCEYTLYELKQDEVLLAADANANLIAYAIKNLSKENFSILLVVTNCEKNENISIDLSMDIGNDFISCIDITAENIYVFTDNYFLKITIEGNDLNKYTYKNNEKNARHIVNDNDIILYGNNNGGYWYEIIDKQSLQIKEILESPQIRIWAGGNNNLFYYNGDGLIKVKPDENSDEMVFAFSDVCIDYTTVDYFFDSIEEEYYFLTNDESNYKIISVNHSISDIIKDEEVSHTRLSLLCVNRSMFQGSTNKYNESNYSNYLEILPQESLENYGIVINKKNYDLLEIPGSSNYEDYVENGYLYDITDYLNSTTSVCVSDYFECVIRDFTIDNKIYAIPRQMYLTDLWGPEEYFSDLHDWNIYTFLNFMEIYPDALSEKRFAGIPETKSRVLYIALLASTNDLISSNSQLDTENLCYILYKINGLDIKGSNLTIKERLKDGEMALLKEDIYSADQLADYQSEIGQKLTPLGFPALESANSGGLISYSNIVGISANTKYPDEAWKYVEYRLSQKYSDDSKEIPTKILDFEKRMKKSTFNENIVINETTYFAVTSSESDKMKEAYTSAIQYNNTHQKVVEIICEEAAPYFKNEKTLDEVIYIMESRINILLLE